MKKLLALVTSLSLLLTVVGTAAAKAPTSSANSAPKSDNLPNPLAEKQAALRATGQEKVAKGQATAKGDNKVVKIAPGQYVELAQTGTDSIFTVLGQFSDLAHNQIAQPDRTVDNTTKWEPDFNQAYYKDMLFDTGKGQNSMANYYLEQSSGRYSVTGDVTDWVSVPQTGAYYGSNAKCDSYAWVFIRDQMTAWVAAQHNAGKTDAQIADYLSQFDVWDRYDYNGNGIYNEPDGYIDHFQSIHSGEGEEAGGGVLGSDAIWSHRWYAFYNYIGVTGPANNQLGGIQIPGTNLWIGDYTIEPENGGVGVFCHEFAHDLGLPDEYDTSGNTGGAENSTGFWTLMSSGSWGNNGQADEGIGDRPFHMNAWDKWALGWLNYDVVRPGGATKNVKLGPAEANTKQAQGMIVVLPDKEITRNVGSAFEGSSFYYSGAANSLDTSMSKSFDLPAGATLSAKVRYSIESDYDYAYVMVDGTKVPTNLSNSSVIADRHRRPFDGLGRPHRHPAGGHAHRWLRLLHRWRRPGRRRRFAGGHRDRRDRDHRTASRWCGDRCGLDVRQQPGWRGLPRHHRHRDVHVLQRVRRGEPAVLGLRRRTGDGSVQLHHGDLGGALPLPGRPAGVVLRLVVLGQQRRRPSGRRPDPSDRRPSGHPPLGG